jgi:hypothetical protein
MLKVRTLLVTFSLLLFAVLVHAQGTVVTSFQVGQGSGTGVGSGGGVIGGSEGVIGGIVGGFSPPSAVLGPPFSADTVDETDQFLADGNHIHRESHGRVIRDSQGRTRTEVGAGNFNLANKPIVFVTIMDMVEGRWIHLDLENKTAMITHYSHSFLSPPARSANGPVKQSVQPLGALATAAAEQSKKAALRERSSEDLGTKEIEGFTANGTRVTRTVPAGQAGNDKPLITISERWFSPDLKIELLTSTESPESGKHLHRLVNIHTGDPDPLLFQVPPDFTIKETQHQ